ncbi:hypothetical protein SANTM175S_10410 [Streptomyces antimycoticus]
MVATAHGAAWPGEPVGERFGPTASRIAGQRAMRSRRLAPSAVRTRHRAVGTLSGGARSAGTGAGHDAVAAELVRRLEDLGQGAGRVDVLELLPHGIGAGLRSFYRTTIRRAPAVYEGIYRASSAPAGAPGRGAPHWRRSPRTGCWTWWSGSGRTSSSRCSIWPPS